VDIANRKGVSKKFLEQIVIPYKKAGLLIGSRGNQGGYKLARAPHLITLKDIIEVSENSLFEKQNEGNLVKEILKGMDQRIDEYFSSITLSTLVDKQIASYGNSYSI
jgi:Rrf2 family protein